MTVEPGKVYDGQSIVLDRCPRTGRRGDARDDVYIGMQQGKILNTYLQRGRNGRCLSCKCSTEGGRIVAH